MRISESVDRIGNNINESRILTLSSQSLMVCSASNGGGEDQDYVKSLVKSKITREILYPKCSAGRVIG